MKLSKRIENIKISKTTGLAAIVDELLSQGKKIINLGIGESYESPPKGVIRAVKKALDNGRTHYGPVCGIAPLLDEIAGEFEGYTKENIIVSNGAKQSLYQIFQVILDPGDEVIIPVPCWVSFTEQVKLAGGVPVPVATKPYGLDIHAIKEAITQKTKAILINTPNNPTGDVYDEKELKSVADLAIAHDLYIISDEAYIFFVYDGLKQKTFFDIKKIRQRLIIIRSFSKSFNMTGFRVGYAAGPLFIVKAMEKIQSHTTGNVCTFAQYGALSALLKRYDMKKTREEFEKKRDLAFKYISEIFPCPKPKGGFYLFPDVSAFLSDGENSGDFAAWLLKKAYVAVVPGEAFGKSNHIRISFATDRKTLKKGLENIKKAIEEL